MVLSGLASVACAPAACESRSSPVHIGSLIGKPQVRCLVASILRIHAPAKASAEGHVSGHYHVLPTADCKQLPAGGTHTRRQRTATPGQWKPPGCGDEAWAWTYHNLARCPTMGVFIRLSSGTCSEELEVKLRRPVSVSLPQTKACDSHGTPTLAGLELLHQTPQTTHTS